MKLYMLLFAFGCFAALAGCRGFYEGFKSAKVEECYRLPYPDQELCLQQADIQYEEYEKERAAKKLP